MSFKDYVKGKVAKVQKFKEDYAEKQRFKESQATERLFADAKRAEAEYKVLRAKNQARAKIAKVQAYKAQERKYNNPLFKLQDSFSQINKVNDDFGLGHGGDAIGKIGFQSNNKDVVGDMFPRATKQPSFKRKGSRNIVIRL